ncbi:MAG TPA: hypothetical protein VFR64_04535 [Methylomirabilota bacterium]|nr:hypothetical protein [Methylomirabilota bacterium]
MRRVLAVLVSVLVAAWPLLLPQTTSAGSPCSNNGGKVYASSSATNIPIAAAVQVQDQEVKAKAEGSNYANGGSSEAETLNVAVPVAVQYDSGNAQGGYGGGGDGGGDGSAAAAAAAGDAAAAAAAAGDAAAAAAAAGGDGDGGAAAAAAAAGGGYGGDGGNGYGGDADGYAKNSVDDTTIINATKSSADGGTAGHYVRATGSQNADAYAGNKGNSASAGDVDVDAGGVSGDPCKQIIKDSVGVMAINGANYFKGNVMQNVNANLGNAANTSVNLGELMPQQDRVVFPAWGEGPYVPDLNGPGQTPTFNINVNPNTNQNTNIISF